MRSDIVPGAICVARDAITATRERSQSSTLQAAKFSAAVRFVREHLRRLERV
jgi:hypothetical protein